MQQITLNFYTAEELNLLTNKYQCYINGCYSIKNALKTNQNMQKMVAINNHINNEIVEIQNPLNIPFYKLVLKYKIYNKEYLFKNRIELEIFCIGSIKTFQNIIEMLNKIRNDFEYFYEIEKIKPIIYQINEKTKTIIK